LGWDNAQLDFHAPDRARQSRAVDTYCTVLPRSLHCDEHCQGYRRMNLFKRCDCEKPVKCRHPFWYEFRLRRQHHRRSTHTANRGLARQIAEKAHVRAVETREGLRPPKPVRLTEHVKAYIKHTAKTNRTSYKDQAVLDRLVVSVGDRSISE